MDLNDFPPEFLQMTMLKVIENLEDYFFARSASHTLSWVTNDEVFLRSVDLLNMQLENLAHQTVQDFRLLCHHRGNVFALFMQGCAEFFHRHNLENGFAIICETALRGYELGIYVYSNLRRIISPDLLVDVEITNPDRGLVRRMRSRTEDINHSNWGHTRLPQLFLDRCAALESDVVYKCRCAASNPWKSPWIENCKESSMCDVCFYTIHVLWFARKFPPGVIEWPMVYEW